MGDMTETVLEVKNLTKKYGSPAGGFLAVDQISFRVREGEILGLLGPNGAGKTTTIQMLLGLTTPTDGKIEYFGKSFFSNREWCLQRMNFASAYTEVNARLTVAKNLRIFAGLYGIKDPWRRIDELLEMFDLKRMKDQLYWELSSGQKTRVNLARSLINSPKLILMDEPTASLDPDIVDRVLTMVERLKKKERVSILFTSHNMTDVTRVCDRVIFLDAGQIVAEDTPLGLTKRVGDSLLVITFDKKQKPVSGYLDEKKLEYRYLRKHVVEIRLPEKMVPKVLFGLSKHGVWLTDIDIQKPRLEDVFLAIAKGGIDELGAN